MEESDQILKDRFQNACNRFAPDTNGREALLLAASRYQSQHKHVQSHLIHLIRSALNQWADLVSQQH